MDAERVVVDHDQRKPDAVPHAGRQLLRGIEEAAVADHADDGRVRTGHLDAHRRGESEPEQARSLGADEPAGPVRRIAILGPIAELRVVDDQHSVARQHAADHLERGQFVAPVVPQRLGEAVVLGVQVAPPRRGAFLPRAGVRFAFQVGPQRARDRADVADQRNRHGIVAADPAVVPVHVDEAFGQRQAAAFGIDLPQPRADDQGCVAAGHDRFDDQLARRVAERQRMILGQHALAGGIRHHGRAQRLGQGAYVVGQIVGFATPHAGADRVRPGQNERLSGVAQQGGRFVETCGQRSRFGRWQRC